MILLEGIKPNHLCYPVALRFKNLLLQAKNCCRVFRNVDTPSLYGHQKFSLMYEIHVDIFGENSRLIGLGNIRIDSVNGLHDAPIPCRKSSISENRGHVAPILGSIVDEVSK